MDTKEAASDSLCIILISQAASLLIGALINSLPDVNLLYVFVMMVGGLLGDAIGHRIGHRIREKLCNSHIQKLMLMLLTSVVMVCVYNAVHFAG